MEQTTYNVTLERVLAGEQSELAALRTQTVTGVTLELPCPGESFAMLAPSLTPGMSTRLVSTSPVKAVAFWNKPEGGYDTAKFTTASGSQYLLKIHSISKVEVVGGTETPQPQAQA